MKAADHRSAVLDAGLRAESVGAKDHRFWLATNKASVHRDVAEQLGLNAAGRGTVAASLDKRL